MITNGNSTVNNHKKNFTDIQNELSRNNMRPTGEMLNIFQERQIGLMIAFIHNYYLTLFQDLLIYKTLCLKEFFNIREESFNKNNNGKKPFEGWIQKKINPQYLRTVFSIF